MTDSVFQKLPAELLVNLIDNLDEVTRLSFALCNKTFFDLAKGANALTTLRYLKPLELRREFLALLERDLPIHYLFCPTCAKFHYISDTKSAGSELINEFVLAPSDLSRNKWACVREDFRNEIGNFFGQQLYFFRARMALKLHQRKHPDAERYISSLNMLELRSDHRMEFRSRRLRSILLPGHERSQLFLRVQHWRLVEAKELRKTRPLDCQYSNVNICYHTIQPGNGFLPDEWQPLIEIGFSKAKSMESIVSKLSIDEQMSASPYWQGEIRYCKVCATDYRLDVLRIPDARSRSTAVIHRILHRDRWAIVVTKWMNLGHLDVQNSLEWQGHAWCRSSSDLVRTSRRIQMGGVLHAFEGQGLGSAIESANNYRPVWDCALETRWKEAVKRKNNKA